MTSRFSVIFAGVVALAAAACSTPTAKSLSDEALAAMGGPDNVKAIKTLTMKDGAGTREQLLEPRHVGQDEAPAKLSKVTEIVDLADGRASMHYVIDNDGSLDETARQVRLVWDELLKRRPR